MTTPTPPKAARPPMEHFTHMVERFIKDRGLDPERNRVKDQAFPAWILRRGSAEVHIQIHRHDDYDVLRVFSPFLKLPSTNILPFYRKCLEMNHGQLLNCWISAYRDNIYLMHERNCIGLDYQELEAAIDYLAAVADDLDDELSEEFHTQRYSDVAA